MRTAFSRLYAACDATGGPMTANKATAQGRIARRYATGASVDCCLLGTIVESINTDPQIAQVGKTGKCAKELGGSARAPRRGDAAMQISLPAPTVGLSLEAVGIMLATALIATPDAAASRLTEVFRRRMALAVGIGIVSAVGGLLLSYALNTASGATIVLLATMAFLGAAWLSLRPRAWRKRGSG
jgi:hypothetical protein